MEHAKILRINELAAKKKAGTLSPEEAAEQDMKAMEGEGYVGE